MQMAAVDSARSTHGQRGALHMCREKFGPRPIFKIFSLDQIRADQEKKEVRKRRASIHRSSPSDALDYFLVSDVIMGIVVIDFVISKNRGLGAISTTLNGRGRLIVTVVVKPFFNFKFKERENGC